MIPLRRFLPAAVAIVAIGAGLMSSGCCKEKPQGDSALGGTVAPPVKAAPKITEPVPLQIIVSREKSLGIISLTNGTIEVTSYSHRPYGANPLSPSVRLEISDSKQSNRISFEQSEIPPLVDAIIRLVTIDPDSLPAEVTRLNVHTEEANFGTYRSFGKYDADIIIKGIRLHCNRDDLKELARLLSLSQAPGTL